MYITARISNQIKGGSVNTDSWTFYPIDVHAALTPKEIFHRVQLIVDRAFRLNKLGQLLSSDAHNKVTLCIFFDEVNTSSCMGVFKELLLDHSCDGQQLPENIVIVAACNPARGKIALVGDRREELGNEWAIGHYQVHPLPASLEQMKWDYGNLNAEQEKEFIEKRLCIAKTKDNLTQEEVKLLSELILTSQLKTREYAKEHIRSLIEARCTPGIVISDLELDARASSTVSLRDILRVFKLFSFFMSPSLPASASEIFLGANVTQQSRRFRAMTLAIAVVYYLRLGTDCGEVDLDYRFKFRNRLRSVLGDKLPDIESVLVDSMSALMDQIYLEPGIAKTRGLQENIFMVVVCGLSQVPLMIVGPPGSSKTLAVTIVAENARGEFSKSLFFKAVPTMIPFRYQCSRRSTSNEIKAVFERSIERQAKSDKEMGNICCFVFMDEAGLPEEGRESLKVTIYYIQLLAYSS